MKVLGENLMSVQLRVIFATLVVFFLASAAAQPVLAQAEAIRFSKVQIDLWPEYDQPGVLVIYRIELSENTPRPAEIALRLPPTASINAVAVRDVDGQLLTVAYDQEASGAWKLVRFQATLPEIQIEYYDSNLTKNGTSRNFVYQWAGDYAVDQALAIIQQPFEATELSVSPGPTTNQLSSDGLTYFTKSIGSLAAGQAFQLDIRYIKDSDRLSVESMEVQPLGDSTTPAATNQDSQYLIIGLLVLLGVGLIGGGSYWYWRSTIKTQPSRKSRSRASVAKATSSQAESEGAYCHKCGRRASTADRFCRGCGERLRSQN
jgi:hypothetical protein